MFTEAEEREFAKQLDREEFVEFTENRYTNARNKQKLRTIRFNVSVLSLLPEITNSIYYGYPDRDIMINIQELLEQKAPESQKDKNIYLSVDIYPRLGDELLKYGFIQRSLPENKTSTSNMFVPTHSQYHFVYTERNRKV